MSRTKNGRAAETGATRDTDAAKSRTHYTRTTRKGRIGTGVGKLNWTPRQTERARDTFAQLKEQSKRTFTQLGKANGCEPWEIVADALATRSGRARSKLRVLHLADEEDTGTSHAPTEKPNAPKQTADAATGRKWRTVRRGGVTYLQSPDGTRYAGTAAEVRDAALYPIDRGMLYTSIRLYHGMYADGTISREELNDVIADRRRESIRRSFISRTDERNDLNENTHTMMDAAARTIGMTSRDFMRQAIMCAICRVRTEYGGELPYTRHERAALVKGGAL